jgi:hypothetical protein
VRIFEWNESTCDTLRDVVDNYLKSARLLLEDPLSFPAEHEGALRWAIADAEQVLADLGEPCDCCREGTWSSPDQDGPCRGCRHPVEQHEEYSGPPGEKGVWQS